MPLGWPSETVRGSEGCGRADYAHEATARGLSSGAPFPADDFVVVVV